MWSPVQFETLCSAKVHGERRVSIHSSLKSKEYSSKLNSGEVFRRYMSTPDRLLG